MKEIKLQVSGLKSFFTETTDVAWQIDQGGKAEAVASLSFDTMESLLTVLTAGRWHLLRALRRNGATSIRHLSQLLRWEYRAVHRDVHALIAVDLIMRDGQGLISVPWERITAEMAMDMAA